MGPTLLEGWLHVHTQINTQREDARLYSNVISHSSSRPLFSPSLWISFTQNKPLLEYTCRRWKKPCGKTQEWLAPQEAPSKCVHLDEVVHCTLSAYGLKPDSVYAINNSLCLHVCASVRVCVVLFLRAAVLPRGPASVSTVITAPVWLSSVQLSCQKRTAQQITSRERERTYTNMFMHKIFKAM